MRFMIRKKTNPTIQDVLDAINGFAGYVQERFEGIDERFIGIDKRFEHLEATVVTKEYLDDKLADLRGDLVIMVRKEDTKLTSLISLLANKKVLSKTEQRHLATMEPFAHI